MNHDIDRLRNVALIAHSGAGKTSLAEAMLFVAGGTTRLGTVQQGTTVMDYDPEETRRGISVATAVAPVEWLDHKINVLDTPGYFDFVGEVKAALRVAEAAIVVYCAASGVEVGSEQLWSYADERSLPRIAFINKMDRENANFHRVLEDLKNRYGSKVVAVTLPIGAAETFKGFIDLIKMKAYLTEGPGKAGEAEIPEELAQEAQDFHDTLVEAVAATDDDLTLKFLEERPIEQQELEAALGNGTRNGGIVPVLCGSALRTSGVAFLSDCCIRCLPSPAGGGKVAGTNPRTKEETSREPSATESTCAFVFKTMADPYVGKLSLFRVYSGVVRSDSTIWNASKDKDERVGQVFLIKGKEQMAVGEVPAGDLGAVAKLQDVSTGNTLCQKDKPILLDRISFPQPSLMMAVQPKGKGDEEKISSGLARLREEDPTFGVEKNAETGQLLVAGVGEVHIEVITSKLSKKFGVEVELSAPKVPYRETIRGTVKVEGKYKKQTGGRGQYGHVWLELEPLPLGSAFEFVDKIFGGAVPRQYVPAVEKGVRETMAEGVLAGYPVVDIRVTIYDGSYHSVDSSEMAFKIASSMAFKKGFADAKPVLLEPIVNLEIRVPEQYMGDIMGDLNKKRGKILGMDSDDGVQMIRGVAPLSEMFRYAIDLRSMTQGRGSFSMKFDHYEEVPAHIAEEIIAQSNRERAS